MNPQRPIEHRLSQWFEEEAPPEIPDRVLQHAFATTRRLRQERSVLGWRFGPVTMRFGLVAAAVAAVVLVAAISISGPWGPRPGAGGRVWPSPSVAPSQSPTPTPSGTREAAIGDWQVSYRQPANWTAFDEDSSVDRGFDAFGSTGQVVGSAGFGILAAAVHPNSSYVVRPLIDVSQGTSVDEYLAWLLVHPRLDVTEPVDVTVAGRRAKQVEFSLKPGENYHQGQIPSRLGVAWFGERSVAIGPSETDHFRFTLVDLGTDTLLVYAWTFGDDLSPVVDQLDELVASMTIEPGPGASPQPAGSTAPSP